MRFQPLRPSLSRALLLCLLLLFAPFTQAQSEDEDEKGFFRSNTWDGSFDAAGDATRQAEMQLKNNGGEDCRGYLRTQDEAGNPLRPDPQGYQQCMQKAKQLRSFQDEAESVRKQQRVFADVSRVSDIAAVGAVGATIVTEMGMKNTSQADSLQQVANIQRTAGYANYAAGATDLALGATAYIHQKKKLEEIQQSVGKNSNSAVSASLSQAVEQTKQAAYNHMLYGAGKMAAGYASVYLSKRTEEQKKALSTYDPYEFYGPAPNQGLAAPTVSGAAPTPPGPAPTYANNQPGFYIPTGKSTLDQTGKPKYQAVSIGAQSSTGASVMPGRSPASSVPKASVSAGGGGSGTGGASPGELQASSEETAEDTKTNEAMGNSFSLSLGGGAPSYAGKSSSDDGDSGASSSTFAAGDKSVATGLNPRDIYSEGLEGVEGTEEGSMAGVNGSRDRTLFVITKERIHKAIETGNVGLSSVVQVKN